MAKKNDATRTPAPATDGAVATDDAVPNGDFQFVENEERNLPVQLETSVLAERGQELGQLGVDIEAAKEARADAASEAQSKIKKLEARRRELQKVMAGAEDRLIECRKEINWEANVVRSVRCDTGEVVDTRAVEPDERQAGLGFDDQGQGDQDGDELPPEVGGNDDGESANAS